MRSHRSLRPGWLPAGMIFLFITAFDPWPTEARAAGQEARCLALAMYWEARDTGRTGMAAVGWVVLNRVADPEFPDEVCAVVQDGGQTPPCQFAWWCDGRSDRPDDPVSWRLAAAIAEELLTDPGIDPTRKALFFHDAAVDPEWRGLERVAEIGTHVFYR
jgi:N-acetylmuramoyl-L-alanine amidase